MTHHDWEEIICGMRDEIWGEGWERQGGGFNGLSTRITNAPTEAYITRCSNALREIELAEFEARNGFRPEE